MSATRVSGEPTGKGAFLVPSATTPGLAWAVEWVTAGTAWCSCPRFARTQACRHVAAVAGAVMGEWRAHSAASTPESRAAAALRLQVLEEIFDR